MARASLGWRALLVPVAVALYVGAHALARVPTPPPGFPSPQPTPSSSPSPSPSDEPTPSPAPGPKGSADIVLRHGRPTPLTFHAKVKQHVRWRNDGPETCVLHADGDARLPGNGTVLPQEGRYEVAFPDPGDVYYACSDGVDPEVRGEVTVEAPHGQPLPTPSGSASRVVPSAGAPITPSTRPSRHPSTEPTATPAQPPGSSSPFPSATPTR